MSEIGDALSRALHGPSTLNLKLDLQAPHKFIIFSDQHKGAGDRADEFRHSMPVYRAALRHYRGEGFKLVLLGDVEELWEQGFKTVERTYGEILQLEGSFPSGHYYRLWGNHDDQWQHEGTVKRYLRPYIDDGVVSEGICVQIVEGGERIGRLFLVHGHQGTLASDKLGRLGPLGLRIYRWLQRIFRIGGNTPAKDTCLRDWHEGQMYEWAVAQKDLILLTGHTHRPVWSSRTHLQKLQMELEVLQQEAHVPLEVIEQKEAEIAERTAKNPPCEESERHLPVYFNAGSCAFDDGDITGMELEDGVLRLVKWAHGSHERIVLEDDSLTRIYKRLR